MKKIFLMMAAVVLGTAPASAQKWTYGLGGGVNYSNFTGDLGDEFEFKPGLQLSLVYNYAFNEKFSLTPELFLLDGGAKLKSGGDISLHYARIPINATYKFAIKGTRNPDSRVLVFAGPYMGYGLRSSEAKPSTFGSKTEFNPWDFGFNIGVGSQAGKIFYKLQYYHGLTNVQNDLQGAKDGGNTSFGFILGYFI